jgi:hypothetical protein
MGTSHFLSVYLFSGSLFCLCLCSHGLMLRLGSFYGLLDLSFCFLYLCQVPPPCLARALFQNWVNQLVAWSHGTGEIFSLLSSAWQSAQAPESTRGDGFERVSYLVSFPTHAHGAHAVQRHPMVGSLNITGITSFASPHPMSLQRGSTRCTTMHWYALQAQTQVCPLGRTIYRLTVLRPAALMQRPGCEPESLIATQRRPVV